MFLHSFPRFAAHTTSSVSYDERHRRATFAYPPLGYQRNRAEATWLQLHGDFHTPNPELSCSGPRGHSDGLSSRLADHDTDDSNNINDSRPGLVSLYSIELIRLRTKDVCELLREPASVYTPARRSPSPGSCPISSHATSDDESAASHPRPKLSRHDAAIPAESPGVTLTTSHAATACQ